MGVRMRLGLKPSKPTCKAVRNLGRAAWVPTVELLEDRIMKGVVLWALGIPIPIIVLLYLSHLL
jgi:hypothetical protein